MKTNGETTLHQRYIYRGYLQIACCDLTHTNHPCLWLITWDPTQLIVTRPLAIRKSGTWYCYGWDRTKNICEVFGSNGIVAAKAMDLFDEWEGITGKATISPEKLRQTAEILKAASSLPKKSAA